MALEDEIEEVEQSSSATVDEGDGIEDMPSTDAGSSSATDEKDTSSIIRDVVGDDEDEPDAGSSPEGEEDEDEDTEDLKGDAEPDNENYSDVPFNKHPRFRELLAENKANKEFANSHRQVLSFLDQNGVTQEEAAEILQVRALANSDPVKAWDLLKPLAQQIATAAGVIVPPNLRERVNKGEMSLEAAQQLARAEAGVETAKTQRERADEQAPKDAETRPVTEINTTVADWEEARKLRDPNFDAKYDALLRETAYLRQTDGHPKDAAGVKAQLEQAYKNVTERFVPPVQPNPAAAPKSAKKAVKPVVGGSVANAPADPKSTVDIIDRVMAKG